MIKLKMVLFYGDDKEITKIIDFFRKECIMEKGKGIRLIDLMPSLTEEYMEEHHIGDN
jgi:hypothetical protein